MCSLPIWTWTSSSLSMRGLLDVVLVLVAAEIGLAHALVGGDLLRLQARIAPCAITVMSSAISNTTSMSCSMMTMSIEARSSRSCRPRARSRPGSCRRSARRAARLAARKSPPCRFRAARRRRMTACRPAARPARSPICSSVRSTFSAVPRSAVAARTDAGSLVPHVR